MKDEVWKSRKAAELLNLCRRWFLPRILERNWVTYWKLLLDSL
jgi:hypothetical protein